MANYFKYLLMLWFVLAFISAVAAFIQHGAAESRPYCFMLTMIAGFLGVIYAIEKK
jgi:hypothetical protein